MSFQILKHSTARILRSAGIVVTSLESSLEGRLQKLMQSYQIDTVLDVGANIGQFATMIRREAKFDGTIVSFEPLKAEFAKLQKAARDDPSWKVINCGLGRTESEMSINVAGNSVSSSLLPASTRLLTAAPHAAYAGTEKIHIRTLDALFSELHLFDARVYLKIDAQGYESNVLAGGENVINYIDTIQMEMPLVPMYEGALLFDQFLPYMQAKGYRLAHLIPGFWDRKTGELLEVDGVFHRDGRP